VLDRPAKLYPSESEERRRVEEAFESLDLWRASGRLRAFCTNPNVAGAFFAGLFVLVGTLAFRFHRPVVRYPLIAAGLACCVPLAMTGSHGAYVAAGVGALTSVVFGLKIGLRKKLFVVLGAFAIVVVLAVAGMKVASSPKVRLRTGDSYRTEILKAFPRMVEASPGGLAFGKSGETYAMWFADFPVMNPSRTLISQHLTWYAELSDAGRIVYVFAWLFAFAALGVSAFVRSDPAAVACLAVLFVAALFNPVLERWWVWLPLAVALAVTCWRCFIPRGRLVLLMALVCAGASWATLFAIDRAGRRGLDGVRVRMSGRAVCLKGREPKTWIVADELTLGGWTYYGQEIRAHYLEDEDAPAVAVVDSIADLPARAERLVLTGRRVSEYVRAWNDPARRSGLCRADAVLFISPDMSFDEIPADLVAASRMRAAAGSLAVRRCPRLAVGKPEWARIVPGAWLYVPGWLNLAMNF